MTLRLLDLTAIFRLLTLKLEGKTKASQPNTSNQSWQHKLRLMAARSRQRRQLLKVSDSLLNDMGLTRAQVLEEANKPFWKA